MSADGNLFAGVNLQDDEEVIQIDKWMNSSELYFFKLADEGRHGNRLRRGVRGA